MLTPTMKAFRIAHLEQRHVATALGALSSTPESLAQVAAGYGATVEDAEKHLSLLCDESLATRTVGSRVTARYAAT